MLIFPATPVPSFSKVIEDEFKTLVSDYDSGAEVRLKLLRFSKRTATLNYAPLPQAEQETLRAFFRNVGGMADSFWYVDFNKTKWTDEYVGRGGAVALAGAVADDGGVQTDQTSAANNTTANDVIVLPAVPAVNDAFYWGFSSNILDTIRINIGTNGAGTWTIVWEYWNGSIWTGLSNVSDGTNGFRAGTGNKEVDFDRPSNWALTTVKTISAYWIRSRVSAYTSVTTQPKGTQAWGCPRLYDLHGVTNTTGDLVVYVDGVTKTGGGTDYTFISGGGEAGVDRIRSNDPFAAGSLITCDLNAYLRIKGRLNSDVRKEELFSVALYNTGLAIREVQW